MDVRPRILLPGIYSKKPPIFGKRRKFRLLLFLFQVLQQWHFLHNNLYSDIHSKKREYTSFIHSLFHLFLHHLMHCTLKLYNWRPIGIVVCEKTALNLVHPAEVGDVGKQYCSLAHFAEVEACLFQICFVFLCKVIIFSRSLNFRYISQEFYLTDLHSRKADLK